MRDLSGIYKESKQSFYLFSTQGLLILKCFMSWPFPHFSPSPLIPMLPRVTSRVTLPGFNFPSTDMGRANIYTFDHLQLMLFPLFWLLFLFTNSVVVVLCSSLQFWYLMRAAETERWPVFVCLWAKRRWLCCVRLSSHCSAKRVALSTASGSPESAGRRWQVTDRSEEEADCWSRELTSLLSPVCLDL